MPLIDVFFAKGSLSPEAQRLLLNTMWSSALRWEAIEANEVSASIAWAYRDERPRRHIGVGPRPMTENIYRINARVMAGFMDQERVDGMSRELTGAELAADGGPRRRQWSSGFPHHRGEQRAGLRTRHCRSRLHGRRAVDVGGFEQMIGLVGEEMHQVAFTTRSAWPRAEIVGQVVVECRNPNFAANGASA
jgi:hypothetical protein